ncbi:pyridoxal phosphatase [Proteus myxofaciens]|uniref:Putative phosphatase n=1 Tax=Proteus myxofaciens ATCC 19692 TaxID=1354337 RepID=A0A198FH59_9GAMM|nr:pyridoxal phosphatase [Proteus myxofaciens]OAT24257.1 putative phosphatase [Proteus myxofaciens ATCC 19692]
MSYRVIALDLDGTLLDDQKRILPESIEALNQARKAGIQVLIVTGRHHVAIHPFYQALQLDTPAICCNGTYLYDYNAKKVLESDPLTTQETQDVLNLIKQTDIHHLVYADDAMLYDELSPPVQRSLNWADTLPLHQRPNLVKVDDFYQAMHDAQSIWKIATTTPNHNELHALVEKIEQQVGLECEWSWVDQVDIAKKGNSKGRRLQRWVEANGMKMSDVVAFGDNFNDLSMLEHVGLGVAMGNASDEVKSRAKLVTKKNTQPGIAETIHKYILS